MTDAGPHSTGVTRLRLLAGRIVLLLPIVLLGVPGAMKFYSGLRIDAAFPVPVYVQMNVRLPKASYEKGVALLMDVDDGGGELLLTAAEAASDIPQSPAKVATLSKQGLSRMPGSARGWLVLSLATQHSDAALSERALAMSYQLSPFDYWIAGWRAQAAADRWNDLDSSTQTTAIWQTKLLWSEPLLHRQLGQLLRSRSGRSLVSLVFHDDPSELSAINQWNKAQTRRRKLR